MKRAMRGNGWHVYRPGTRLSEEGDAMFAEMAKMRCRGLIEVAEYARPALAAMLESAYMQGFEDCWQVVSTTIIKREEIDRIAAGLHNERTDL